MRHKFVQIFILLFPYVALAFLISVPGGLVALFLSIVVMFIVPILEDKFPLLLLYMATASSIVSIVSSMSVNGFWKHSSPSTYFFAGLGGALFVWAAFSLALWISIEPIMTLAAQLNKAHWTDVVGYMLSFLFHTRQPWIVVDNGKIIAEKPAGVMKQFGGPGVLVINPGHVVVTVRRGNVSQILGHGVYRLHRLEKIKKIVDVSPQWKTFWTDNILTRDGIPLRVKLGVGYQIKPCEQQDLNSLPKCGANVPEHIDALMLSVSHGTPAWDCCLTGSFPVRASNVLKAVFKPASDDWTVAPSMAVSVLVDIIGQWNLDELLGVPTEQSIGSTPGIVPGEIVDTEAVSAQRPSDEREKTESNAVLTEIAGLCKDKASGIFEGWGLRLNSVRVFSMELPKELKGSWFSHWITLKEAEAEKTSMETRARGAGAQIKALGEAKREAFQETVETFNKAIEALAGRAKEGKEVADVMDLMTLISERLAAGDVIAYRYLHVLENIARAGGDKVFLIGGEDRELLEAVFRSKAKD